MSKMIDFIRAHPYELGLIAGGLLVVKSAPSRRPSRRRKTASAARRWTPIPVTEDWKDKDSIRRIMAIARPIEQLANWPNLGVFLSAVCWIESRGNPNACASPCGSNSARGLFQVRPKSARVADLGLPASVLFNERYAVALAAWYAFRMQKYGAPGHVVDWLAVRRGWASFVYVDDVNSPGFKNQFAKGLAHVSIPTSFMYEPAFPPGFNWPGIDAVIAAAQGAQLA